MSSGLWRRFEQDTHGGHYVVRVLLAVCLRVDYAMSVISRHSHSLASIIVSPSLFISGCAPVLPGVVAAVVVEVVATR